MVNRMTVKENYCQIKPLTPIRNLLNRLGWLLLHDFLIFKCFIKDLTTIV